MTGHGWLKRVERDGGPVYLALVGALEAAIRAGELQPGDQLPPQRAAAAALGVDFTTVTRAYAVARARGLVEGAVGRGTFVRARAADDDAGLIDLSMNLPPPPQGVSLGALLRETTAAVLGRTDPAALMAYHPGAGTLAHRTAGAAWLAPHLGEVEPARILVCPGAQAALVAALSAICRPGDALAVEALSYPGIKAAAAHLGLRLVPCAGDGEGLLPEALERACREHRPAALYVVPAMQNPTATIMGEQRRRDIVRAAAAHGLWIIEDDPYSRLMESPAPALAAHAPERTVHLSTLSKCLSPGLRLAYAACPPALAGRMESSLRAVALMPAPLMSAVVTSWIREGTAEDLLAAVRREARARRELASQALPEAAGSPESIHVWAPLPQGHAPGALHRSAQSRGLSLVTADAFATGESYPNGVRISLGGPGKRAVLAAALAEVAAILRETSARKLAV